MSLLDLLGMGPQYTVSYGLPGAQDFGVNSPDAVAQQQPAPVAQPQEAAFHSPHGIKNLLGMIGDALLVAGGRQPMYQPELLRRQEQSALQGFLTNPDDAIRQLMQVDAKAGIDLYRAVHPASEIPDTAKVYEYRQKLTPEQQAEFDRVNQTLHPGLFAPVTLGPNDTIEGGQAPTSEITATGPNGEKIRLNSQTGKWEPISGGATASTPSPTFRPAP